MNGKYKMSDSVLHRFVQILQEAILTGTDVSDHLRMVEMRPDETDPHVLVLTDDYKDMVKKHHDQMLDFAAQEQGKRLLVEEKSEEKN